MKIYCEKCRQEISSECNKQIENYKVGKVICPHCHYEQKRYLSEADILLYFGISEVLYVLLSLISVFVFKKLGVSAVSIGLLFVLLVASYFVSKLISSSIYEKAYFKAEWKNKEFEEDQSAIQRNISWQFMRFFAITITFLTMEEGNLEKESVEPSFKAIWEKIEEENTFYQRPVLNRILKKLCEDSFLQSFIFLFLIFRSEAVDTA